MSFRLLKFSRVVRYEDLTRNITEGTKDILSFYGLDFHPNVQDFLQTHTSKSDGRYFGTHRETKSSSTRWSKSFKRNSSMILEIQKSCSEALSLWGYHEIKIDDDPETFDPVGQLDLWQTNKIFYLC